MGGLLSKPKPKSSSYQELPDAPNPPPYNPKDETVHASKLPEDVRSRQLSQAVHMLTRAGYTFKPGDETTQVLAGLDWLKAECSHRPMVGADPTEEQLRTLLARCHCWSGDMVALNAPARYTCMFPQ
jgi:hypothetical protein